MILRVVSAKVCGPCSLELSFSDGTAGIADVSPLLQGPVFEPLRNSEFFAQARLDEVCGTVVWPNGADFAPEALHRLVAESSPSAADAPQP